MQEYITYHRCSLSKLKLTYDKICAELGVEYFGYTRIYQDDDNKYVTFSNNSKIIENHIKKVDKSEIYFETSLPCGNINNKTYYFNLWPKVPSSYSMQIFSESCWNGLHAVLPSEEYIDIWFVGTDPLNERIQTKYYEEIYRKKFLFLVEFFNRSKSELVEDIDKIDMPYYKNGYDFKLPFANEVNKIKRHNTEMKNLSKDFYPQGIPVKTQNGIIKIDYKNSEFLRLLSLGYSNEQIANIMCRSSRTVEKYPQNLKEKTGLKEKHELISLYNDQIKFLIE